MLAFPFSSTGPAGTQTWMVLLPFSEEGSLQPATPFYSYQCPPPAETSYINKANKQVSTWQAYVILRNTIYFICWYSVYGINK